MTEWIDMAAWVAAAVGLYLAGGLLFALAFTLMPGTSGLLRVDPGARGMPLPARLLIVPGVAALWPLMLFKWLRRSPPVA